jgi:hypothetical protein
MKMENESITAAVEKRTARKRLRLIQWVEFVTAVGLESEEARDGGILLRNW